MVTDCDIISQTFKRRAHTWLHTVNSNGTLTEVMARSYSYYCDTLESDLSLTDLESQCLYKRSGTLCGQCQSSYIVSCGQIFFLLYWAGNFSRPNIKEKRSGHARLVVTVQHSGLHNVKYAPILGCYVDWP